MENYKLHLKGSLKEAKAAILANIQIGQKKEPKFENRVEEETKDSLKASTLLGSTDGERVVYLFKFLESGKECLVTQTNSDNVISDGGGYKEFEKSLNGWIEKKRKEDLEDELENS